MHGSTSCRIVTSDLLCCAGNCNSTVLTSCGLNGKPNTVLKTSEDDRKEYMYA